MAIATRLKLKPADHGRPIAYQDFLASDTVEGYHYELIDGRVYVSPQANPAHMWLDRWVFKLLERYSCEHPDIINLVYYKARVFVPGRKRSTCPEPDIAAYHDFPLAGGIESLSWEGVSPLLVVEILSPDNLDKDLVRNVGLYLKVPSIQEYWVVNGLEDAERPELRVYRRRGKKWRIIEVAGGDTYTSKLLPGFELVLNPRG
jgi:Uma2 family endonuclease